jgi:F-type H+-transporting ATPase subunit delta
VAKNDNTTIAEVYARALIELAAANNAVEAIDQELSEFVAYLKIEKDFRDFFESPVIDEDARRASLDKMFEGRTSDLLLNTLQVLNRKGRTELVIDVQLRYHELVMAKQGIVEVQVTTAEPLDSGNRDLLQDVMSRRTGKTAVLVEHVDANLIGGLVVRVDNEQVDLSISSQLERLHDTVLDHASRHIQAGTSRFFAGSEHA